MPERDGKQPHLSELLDLHALLVKEGLAASPVAGRSVRDERITVLGICHAFSLPGVCLTCSPKRAFGAKATRTAMNPGAVPLPC